MITVVLFYVFAALAVASALVVIGQRNPIYSAFGLIVTLCSMAAIFGLLGSPFIAALQVVVYAGAIMVLFLFVLMLLGVKAEDRTSGSTLKAVATALALALALEMGVVLLGAVRPAAASFDSSTRAVAKVLFSAPYLYVFEATSILILAALVGSIVLARRDA
jgi:NADH-quinone oxidoreductase subunit J